MRKTHTTTCGVGTALGAALLTVFVTLGAGCTAIEKANDKLDAATDSMEEKLAHFKSEKKEAEDSIDDVQESIEEASASIEEVVEETSESVDEVVEKPGS